MTVKTKTKAATPVDHVAEAEARLTEAQARVRDVNGFGEFRLTAAKSPNPDDVEILRRPG